jgi:hypothetical protein
MIARRVAAMMMLLLLIPASEYAANPFLNASDDKPVSAEFRGSEWGDEIDQEEIPLSARVSTTRIATMPWGAIFKIEFSHIKSRADKQRGIRPVYFIATDDRIVLLNEEDNDTAIKKISALDKSPDFGPNDIYCITSGAFEHQEGEWKTTIQLKDDSAFTMRAILPGILKKSFGKKASAWLNTATDTAPTPAGIG